MVNGIDAAFPTISRSFKTIDATNIHKPEATMPFIKALADRFGFDIQEEWNSFMGISEKKRKKTAQQKVDFYLTEIEQTLNIARSQVLARSRKREIIQVRQMLTYICFKNGLGSLKYIGELVGGFDHSVVIHSVQTVRDLRDSNNPTFMPVYNALIHLVEKK